MSQTKRKNNKDVIKDNFSKLFENYFSNVFALLLETHSHEKSTKHTYDITRYKNVERDGNHYVIKAKITDIDEVSKISNDKFLRDTNSVIHDSHFCYLHTLFERFLIQLVEYAIKTNPEIKKKYIQKMNSIGSDTKYSYMMLMKSTNTLKDRISRIDDIAKAESGILNLCKMLLIESDKKSKDDANAKNFYIAKNRYIEMKERNNLIKHRGFTYDEKYIKNIEQTLDQKSSINDLLKSLGVIKKDARKELIGKNAQTYPKYFQSVASTIIFLSSYFIYNVCNTDDERETFLNNVIHGLLKVSYELSSLSLNNMSIVLISLFGEFEKQPKTVQFNFILSVSRRNEFRNKYFKKPRNEKEREIEEKVNNRYKVFEDEIPKTMKLDDAYKKLISYYLKNKTEDFLSHCFSMDKIESDDFQNWAIFQKYHKNKSFLSRFKSKYKTDFKPTKEYV